MKRQPAFAWLASGLVLMLIPFMIVLKSRVSASNSKTKLPARELARLGDQAIVHAAGRVAPRINLADGREVLTAYAGDLEAQRLLQQNLVQPLSMASGDFDEDGMPDLISAYAGPNEGVITLHSGNVDAMFPESLDAKQRKVRGEFTDAPFLSPARVFRLPERPDFIGAGDFNADGHFDVILAALGGNSLHLLPGDGRGGFGAPVNIQLPGRVTTMISGAINRRDGPSAVAVGVAGADGAQLLILEGARGMASPETIALPAEANAVAFGHFDDDFESEVAVAAGNSLMIVRVGAARAGGKPPRISKRSFPFSIQSLATGDFTGNHSAGLALLSGGGEVVVLSRPLKLSSAPIKDWSSQLLSRVRLQPVTQLIAARVSSLPLDTIVVVNSTEHRLILLTNNIAASTNVGASTTDAELDAEAEPVAALPMSLNGDALGDLVVLTKGRGAPTVIIASPSATFTVTNTGDTGAGSLRDAITQANGTPGSLINFSLGAGTPTIMVGSTTGLPLPFITGATTTIDGNTGGATRVELNGSLAGAAADGLTTLSPGNTIRGLVINRFSGSGINLRLGDGNVVTGNFIGTNAAGLSASANAGQGVQISSMNNTIGGTTAAARNVISGSGSSGIALSGALATNNLVQGNFIGTDASGAAPVPNTRSGVGINANNNTVGGTLPVASNVIAFNTTVGVDVVSGTGNAILGNAIFSNGSLGINLKDDGGTVTPNDPDPPGCPADADTGANNLQNFPVLTSATLAGGTTTIAGTLNSTALTVFRIEFFSSDACDPSGNGEGQAFVGSTMVTTASDCGATFISIAPAVSVGKVITATATDPGNNTSEFSACVAITAASADMSVGLTDSPDPVSPGGNINYSITATNNGPNAATNVVLSESTPANTNFQSINAPAGWSCATPGVGGTGPITCTNPNVASGASFPFTLVVQVNPGTANGTVITDMASVSSATPDPNPGNNAATTTTTVVVAACTITCPPNQTLFTGPNATQCGRNVDYPAPTTMGVCGTVTCKPASGAFFPVGTTTVTCTTGVGPSCSFSVNVFDNTPPTVTCPPDIVTTTSPGQPFARVTFTDATATDNCPPASVVCSPPSGSQFPAGTTLVNCTATDPSKNAASCFFRITVRDTEAPVIRCPANVTVNAQQACAIAVTYPVPAPTDNVPGVTAACSPDSGSTFPVGVTTVTCTATDKAGNKATCTFTVNVTGGTIKGDINPSSIDLKRVKASSQNPNKRTTTGGFFIRSTGCGVLTLGFTAFRRITDQNKLGNLDDPFFSVFRQAPDGSPTGPNLIGKQITINPGDQNAFDVQIVAIVPAVEVHVSTPLNTRGVLPDNFQTMLVIDGLDKPVIINANVKPGVKLIDPVNPQRTGPVVTMSPALTPQTHGTAVTPQINDPVVTICRSGNLFIVTYHIYDSNKSDVKSATFEFLDSANNVIQTIDNIDLAGPIGQANLVNGQSFTLQNSFSGANDNQGVSRVRITVFGAASSDSALSSPIGTGCAAAAQLSQSQQRTALVLPVVNLDRRKP